MNDLGGLSPCMVDGDGGAISRARRVRGKALAASVFLVVTVIVAMFLWPLITLAVLPPLLVVTPVPPAIPAHVSRAAETEPPGEPMIEISSGQGNTGPGSPGIDSRTAVIIVPPAPETPRVISRGVLDAALIHRVQPEYPTPAKRMRLSGIVRLRGVIGTEGDVRELEVVSGNSILARAAVEAVRQLALSAHPIERCARGGPNTDYHDLCARIDHPRAPR